MKRFMLLYKGPATPPGASHDKWPAWFDGVGDHLVEAGSPMAGGLVLHHDGSSSDSATSLNGYSIVQAKSVDEALDFTRNHPYLALGTGEYTVEIFELTG